jgi:hypothetical protein
MKDILLSIEGESSSNACSSDMPSLKKRISR